MTVSAGRFCLTRPVGGEKLVRRRQRPVWPVPMQPTMARPGVSLGIPALPPVLSKPRPRVQRRLTMKTTTIKIATTAFTAAIKAGTKQIVTVISAVESSRPRWRHVSAGFNPGVFVVGQRFVSLVPALAMRHASPAMATMCRPSCDVCSDRRPNYSAASRLLTSV